MRSIFPDGSSSALQRCPHAYRSPQEQSPRRAPHCSLPLSWLSVRFGEHSRKLLEISHLLSPHRGFGAHRRRQHEELCAIYALVLQSISASPLGKFLVRRFPAERHHFRRKLLNFLRE